MEQKAAALARRDTKCLALMVCNEQRRRNAVQRMKAKKPAFL
jgi:hypothetical protein